MNETDIEVFQFTKHIMTIKTSDNFKSDKENRNNQFVVTHSS